jgi:peroxiredoxin family protein
MDSGLERNSNHRSAVSTMERLDMDPMRVETSMENASSRSRCVSFLCQIVQLAHSFAVVLLGCAVLVLFLQLQQVKTLLAGDDKKIADLYELVQNQQANQETLNVRVEQEHSLTMYQIAGTFCLLTCLLTAFHMTQHLSNFHEAVVQRKIVTILWMSPIYSITSWLSLVFPSSDGYLAVVKDFYEAYVIYTFLSFMISVLGRGDREAAVRVVACHASHLKQPTRCLSSCYHPPPDRSDTALASAVLMECQILAMQFVLVRPVTSILSFVSEIFIVEGAEQTNDPYYYFKTPGFYISMITNVSVFFAFNGLLKVRQQIRCVTSSTNIPPFFKSLI